MVSLRRTSDGRASVGRSPWRPAGVVLVVLAALVLGACPAAADPPPPVPPPTPTSAADAQARLDQVQREAEALTEQWHAAQDTLATRQQEITRMQAAVGPAQALAATARADEESYRKQVDVVAHGDVRERQPRPARRDARRPLAAGLPRPDVGARDDLVRLQGRARHPDRQGRRRRSGAVRGRRGGRAGRRPPPTRPTRPSRTSPPASATPTRRISQAEQMLRALSPAQLRARNGPHHRRAVHRRHRHRRGRSARRRHAAGQALRLGRERARQLRLLGPDVLGLLARGHHASRARAASRRASARPSPGPICSPAILSSTTTRSATSGSTPATASSSTRRRPATSSATEAVQRRTSPAPGACRRPPRPRPLPIGRAAADPRDRPPPGRLRGGSVASRPWPARCS